MTMKARKRVPRQPLIHRGKRSPMTPAPAGRQDAEGPMEGNLRFGFSPCPNDTFIFFGLAEGRIDLHPLRPEIFLADVEALNQRARQGLLEVSKVSISAVVHLLEDYALMRSGGAIGRGCGPLVVTRQPRDRAFLQEASIAIPGRLTTAHLLLQMTGWHQGPCVEMPFDRIMPAVAAGEVDAGLIIHEGRFTYPQWGLHLLFDLGRWWEEETGLPLPLGGVVIRRSLGRLTAQMVEEKIRESLLYGRENPEEVWPYIVRHAQELTPEVIHSHIDTFVNDFSLHVDEEGERAIRVLLESAARVYGLPFTGKALFWNDSID